MKQITYKDISAFRTMINSLEKLSQELPKTIDDTKLTKETYKQISDIVAVLDTMQLKMDIVGKDFRNALLISDMNDLLKNK